MFHYHKKQNTPELEWCVLSNLIIFYNLMEIPFYSIFE